MNYQSNSHILISNGHGSHDSLEAIEYAQKLGLDMLTLFNHASHTL
jgi:hypothetical protein